MLLYCTSRNKGTSSEFYKCQVSGVIECVLKLYGQVDAEKLLKAMGKETGPSATDIRHVATLLNDLKLHGAILSDEVGFGKTKQSLLVTLLHSVLYTEMTTRMSSRGRSRPGWSRGVSM